MNLSAQLLFDFVEIESVIPIDQVDSQAEVTKSTRATDTVQIGLGILREVKVDHNIDSLDVNASCKEIRTDQIPADAIPEVVKHAIPVVLKHSSVRIEA